LLSAHPVARSHDRFMGVRQRGQHFLGNKLAVHVRQGYRDLGGADVDADNNAGVVEPQEGGAAAAQRSEGGAFEDPVLLDELLDDRKDGAALQATDAAGSTTLSQPSPP
jgi:hypothetical protein